MQIRGLHKNIYRLERYARTQELLSDVAARRQKLLGDWDSLKARRVPDTTIAKVTGISRATYYRRAKALRTYGLKGLEKRSKRPHKTRQSQIPKAAHRLILMLRMKNPTYGKAKITVLLKRDHGVSLSESSVGRVLTALMRQGKIQRYRASASAKRKRSFKGHAQRFVYGSKAKKPGALIQIDHMSVRKNGLSFKHFQAWDPVTKTIIARITSNATSAAAAQFLKKLQDQLPFRIQSIQVDGGSEFMRDFEKACQEKKIPLFVLPPKRPQWNGGVERANRTFREDFYARADVLGSTLAEIQTELEGALHKYNTYRPHQRLKGLTPSQYTALILDAQQSHML